MTFFLRRSDFWGASMHTSVVELEQRRNDFGGGGRAPPGRSCRTDLGTTTRGRRRECCSAGGILIPARGCARRRDAVVHRNPSSPSRFTREPTAAGGVGGDATAVPQAAGRRPRFFFPKGRAPRSASRANADPQPRTVGVGLSAGRIQHAVDEDQLSVPVDEVYHV